MRFRRPFDINAAQMEILGDIVSKYYEDTRDKMPVPDAWLSMGDEDLWRHLIRIIIAMGRSAPSYRLMASPDFENLSMGSMKVFQDRNGKVALAERTHRILAKYQVRYCSPGKNTSVKARVIVDNLNEPALVSGKEFVLLEGIRSSPDPRFYLMERVSGYGMKSASEFLTEIGYSQDYLAFDSRLKRTFSLIFGRDFDRGIRTPMDYMDFEEVFREEICPGLGIRPSELDAIVFWNYGSILKGLMPSRNK
jgi:thermostable 8-oxoguanine DNA glycosylase